MPPTRIVVSWVLWASLAGAPFAPLRAQEPPTDEDGPLGLKLKNTSLETTGRASPANAASQKRSTDRVAPAAPAAPAGPATVEPRNTPRPAATADPKGAPAGDPGDPAGAAFGPSLPPLPPAPTGTPAERERWLSDRIDEILSRQGLTGIHSGVMVAEIDTGRTLYARDERSLYNPASNAKLITTAAALGLLGPEFRFKTGLWAASVKNGEVQGDLFIKGSGDPSLTTEDLWRLVADLANSGVHKINGTVVIDDTYFDDVRVGPAFEQKSEDYAFRAPEGAVSFNYNACTIRITPALKEGTAPKVVVEPGSPYFKVTSTAMTVAKGKTDLSVSSREIDGHTEIAVAGNLLKTSGEVVEHRRIVHPDLYTGYALRELLGKRGIKIGGNGVQRGAVPPGSRQLASHSSAPLGVIVREVNKTSNNFMAEQLLKTLGAEVMGKPGTWPKGVEAVARFLDGVGIAVADYKMVNGSGLYDADRFTPAQLVELLRHAYRDFRFAADFVGSLAVAGADGTIGHRMENGSAERWVRAKTGTLAGVSCLSGYAGSAKRMPLAFSILMNGVSENATGDARKAQDAIAEAMVTFLGAN